MRRHRSSAQKKRGSVYHDASSRMFKCDCGARLRWASRQSHLSCSGCGKKHHRGVDLRAPNPGTEDEKAKILGVTRYTLWRYRQGMAGKIPPGRKPVTAMLLAIKRIDREFRNAVRKAEDERAARGE